MKSRLFVVGLLIALLCGCRARLPRPAVVDTASQRYTYARMCADIDSLAARYPGWISVMSAGTTAQGRGVPLVVFGNPKAEHKVMVQAAMHAREYMSSQLVMAMLDVYSDACGRGGEIGGLRVDTLFNRVCFMILPMANPDGVSIAQFGSDAVFTPDARAWVDSIVAAGTPFDQIKSNSRGVDINRNFTNGFGMASNAAPAPAFDHYPGPRPLSEVESRVMLDLSRRHDFDCFLNYHTSGNLIYYGCGNADTAVNEQARLLSDLIGRHTGYTGYGPESAPPNGSWADEVEVLYSRPSATVELGTRNPVPIAEFDGLYRRNLPVWASLARSLILQPDSADKTLRK